MMGTAVAKAQLDRPLSSCVFKSKSRKLPIPVYVYGSLIHPFNQDS